MYSIENIKDTLTELVNIISSIIDVEFAIFDTNSNLIASTKMYEKLKGRNVHSASIDEVLLNGNVIVNKPGYMKSCIGCRFANNCPSTIELLYCIKINDTPIGVVSLTSFTKDGHKLISSNIHKYKYILENMGKLISTLTMNNYFMTNQKILDETIEELVESANENLLVTDNRGIIIYCSSKVQEWFSFCDLYTKSINQLFNENIVQWLSSEKPTNKKYIVGEIFSGFISSIPIKVDNKFYGYIIKMQKENKTVVTSPKESFLDKIITKNNTMVELKKIITKIANSPSTVLITGETGTGKELFAKSIHYSGNRKDNPFVPINCANIPGNLFESELFGYEEGAFTGAKKGGKPGLFEIANGGTIFLDEIGELPMYLQAKLLRILQDGKVQRLGSLKATPIDVRVISATNKNLEEMIEENTFREDLYYRLNVIPLYIPPLRDRRNDIETLSFYFLEKYSVLLNKNINGISKEALSLLTSYYWPGNVRELENAIEYAVNMEEKNTIHLKSLPDRLRNTPHNIKPEKNNLAYLEYNLIKSTLDKYGWDVKGKEKAAEELGMSLRTLYRKLKEANTN